MRPLARRAPRGQVRGDGGRERSQSNTSIIPRDHPGLLTLLLTHRRRVDLGDAGEVGRGRAEREGGADLGMPNLTPTSSVINRSPDPAVIDNAYALSGPREVASLTLIFEDGDNLASVWSASISQVVENQNQPDLDTVRRKLEPGIARALQVLPDAPTP